MKRFALCMAMVLLFCRSTVAEPVVRVVKPGAAKSAIDLSGFSAVPGGTPAQFKAVLLADLEKSGWFSVVDKGRGTFSVEGSCEESRGLTVKCRVSNSLNGDIKLSKSFKDNAPDYRRLAHKVADEIVLAIKGCAGMASARIAMVGTASGSKEIYVSDYDGGAMVKLTSDKSVCIAPEWTPDGNKVVYTSFRAAFPRIYAINLASSPATRSVLTDFPGLNLSAAVSPDGRKVALILSKDGNPDLYVMNLATRALKRVTRTSKAGEASPSWSPDGRRLVFVSDSQGRPNLFTANEDGSGERRMTFAGSENVSPDWGSNGLIAYSTKQEGRYRICVMDPEAGQDGTIVTTDNADYDDPSWAPDGRHIVCARTDNRRSDVYVIDTMGDPPICLSKGKAGDWYSPAWSPR